MNKILKKGYINFIIIFTMILVVFTPNLYASVNIPGIQEGANVIISRINANAERLSPQDQILYYSGVRQRIRTQIAILTQVDTILTSTKFSQIDKTDPFVVGGTAPSSSSVTVNVSGGSSFGAVYCGDPNRNDYTTHSYNNRSVRIIKNPCVSEKGGKVWTMCSDNTVRSNVVSIGTANTITLTCPSNTNISNSVTQPTDPFVVGGTAPSSSSVTVNVSGGSSFGAVYCGDPNRNDYTTHSYNNRSVRIIKNPCVSEKGGKVWTMCSDNTVRSNVVSIGTANTITLTCPSNTNISNSVTQPTDPFVVGGTAPSSSQPRMQFTSSNFSTPITTLNIGETIYGYIVGGDPNNTWGCIDIPGGSDCPSGIGWRKLTVPHNGSPDGWQYNSIRQRIELVSGMYIDSGFPKGLYKGYVRTGTTGSSTMTSFTVNDPFVVGGTAPSSSSVTVNVSGGSSFGAVYCGDPNRNDYTTHSYNNRSVRIIKNPCVSEKGGKVWTMCSDNTVRSNVVSIGTANTITLTCPSNTNISNSVTQPTDPFVVGGTAPSSSSVTVNVSGGSSFGAVYCGDPNRNDYTTHSYNNRSVRIIKNPCVSEKGGKVWTMCSDNTVRSNVVSIGTANTITLTCPSNTNISNSVTQPTDPFVVGGTAPSSSSVTVNVSGGSSFGAVYCGDPNRNDYTTHSYNNRSVRIIKNPCVSEKGGKVWTMCSDNTVRSNVVSIGTANTITLTCPSNTNISNSVTQPTDPFVVGGTAPSSSQPRMQFTSSNFSTPITTLNIGETIYGYIVGGDPNNTWGCIDIPGGSDCPSGIGWRKLTVPHNGSPDGWQYNSIRQRIELVSGMYIDSGFPKGLYKGYVRTGTTGSSTMTSFTVNDPFVVGGTAPSSSSVTVNVSGGSSFGAVYCGDPNRNDYTTHSYNNRSVRIIKNPCVSEKGGKVWTMCSDNTVRSNVVSIGTANTITLTCPSNTNISNSVTQPTDPFVVGGTAPSSSQPRMQFTSSNFSTPITTLNIGETIYGYIVGGDPNNTWGCIDIPGGSDCPSGIGWRKLTVPHNGSPDGWQYNSIRQRIELVSGMYIDSGFPKGLYKGYVRTGTTGSSTMTSFTVNDPFVVGGTAPSSSQPRMQFTSSNFSTPITTLNIGETIYGYIVGGDPNNTWGCIDIPGGSDCPSGIGWRKLTVPHNGSPDGWQYNSIRQRIELVSGMYIDSGFPKGLYKGYVRTGTTGSSTMTSFTVNDPFVVGGTAPSSSQPRMQFTSSNFSTPITTLNIGETIYGYIVGGDPNNTWGCIDIPGGSDCPSGIGWRKLTVPHNGSPDGWQYNSIRQRIELVSGMYIDSGFPKGLYKGYVRTGTTGSSTMTSFTVNDPFVVGGTSN